MAKSTPHRFGFAAYDNNVIYINMTIQRHFWVMNLLGISMISYLLADISGQYIMDRLRQHIPTSQKKVSAISEKPDIRHDLGYYDAIADKDIFTKKKKIVPTKKVVQSKVESKQQAVSAPVQSKLDFLLVGTIIKGGKGYIAFLEDKKTKKQSGYHLGDMLLPDTKLVNIKRKSIIVERNGKREILEYPSADKKSSKRRRARPASRRKSSEGVTAVSDKDWMLDKRYVDAQLKDMGRLMTQIRAVPAGKKGFKVFNIKKNSLFDKIGLKNGDIVKRINNVDITSPDKAIEMYQQLQGASDIQIDLLRNGSVQSFNYSIR